jgi:hypothetical protein
MTYDESGSGGPSGDAPTRIEWTDDRWPSTVIVEAVAEASGHDPTALPPLQDYVDADAVDRLLADGTSGETDIRLSFRYDGMDVVAGDGWVEARLNRSGGTGERA